MVLPVTKIMRKRIATCSPRASVLTAVKRLKEFNTSTVVIVDGQKRVLGVFSERDLVNRVVASGKDPKRTRITEVMTSPALCGDISQNDIQLANLIISQHVKKVPILKKGKLVGIVAESDLLKHLAESIFSDD